MRGWKSVFNKKLRMSIQVIPHPRNDVVVTPSHVMPLGGWEDNADTNKLGGEPRGGVEPPYPSLYIHVSPEDLFFFTREDVEAALSEGVSAIKHYFFPCAHCCPNSSIHHDDGNGQDKCGTEIRIELNPEGFKAECSWARF